MFPSLDAFETNDMFPSLLDAKQFASRTDGNSVFPHGVHGDRADVPRLTWLKLEHFRPKRARNPFGSPASTAPMAVLSVHSQNIVNSEHKLSIP